MSECGVRQEQNNQINGGELNKNKNKKDWPERDATITIYIYNNRTVKHK